MTAWLLTWMWQGVTLAVCLSVVLHLAPRINAATRYVLWWGAFVALVPLGWLEFGERVALAAADASSRVPSSQLAAPVFAVHVPPLPSSVLEVVWLVWASVALFRLLRIFPGLNGLYR